MIPFVTTPPPQPAKQRQQQIVIQQATAQPALNPLGRGGKRTFANRTERRTFMSLVRRAVRRAERSRWSLEDHLIVERHKEHLGVTRAVRSIYERTARLARQTPANA